MEQNQEIVQEAQVVEPIIFDPRKEYAWGDDVQITLDAKEFNLLYNAAAITLGNPISLYTLKLLENAYSILQDKLKSAVEQGMAIERKDNTIPLKSEQAPEDNI